MKHRSPFHGETGRGRPSWIAPAATGVRGLLRGQALATEVTAGYLEVRTMLEGEQVRVFPFVGDVSAEGAGP